MTTFKKDTARAFLSRLEKVRRLSTGRFNACCPAHGDRNPSMSVTVLDDKMLLHCHSRGCDYESILAAVGFKHGDFYDDEWEPAKRSAMTIKVKPYPGPPSERQIDLKVIELAKADIAAGKTINQEDRARVQLAMERLKNA